MNNRKSNATIEKPQFVNLQPIDMNPMISKCDIKVLYIGQNRNQSFITKEVATEMSKTLRGCPIIGYYIESKEDFGDHGNQMIVDGEGVRFNKLTKPYGFIPTDARVWFQFFEDEDEFGNTCIREYLMTEGYLWAGQFEECKRVLENNNPQSMELDEKTLEGFWSTDINKGIDFFIINRATISSLCILGDDVEPCFEGASVSAPTMSSQFNLDNFMNELTDMMAELKFALKNNKGGQPMLNANENVTNAVDTTVEQVAFENKINVEAPKTNFEDASATSENVKGETSEPTAEVSDSFAKKDEKDDKEDENKAGEQPDSKDSEDKKDKEKSEDKKDEEEDEDKKKKFALEKELAELQVSFAALKAENEGLIAFKQEVENKQKDELIASFYMLSDEDKKDVVENKVNYSLDEIEAKLSILCVRKKVNFAKEEPIINEVATTFNLNSIAQETDNAPAWVKAVKANRNR